MMVFEHGGTSATQIAKTTPNIRASAICEPVASPAIFRVADHAKRY